jgi:hypothetical protein
VAVHLVKLACERPDRLGRSLSQWDCLELARQLEREGLVESISPETVRRILEHHKLKPWRHHLWLSPHTPHDGVPGAIAGKCTVSRITEQCLLMGTPIFISKNKAFEACFGT